VALVSKTLLKSITQSQIVKRKINWINMTKQHWSIIALERTIEKEGKRPDPCTSAGIVIFVTILVLMIMLDAFYALSIGILGGVCSFVFFSNREKNWIESFYLIEDLVREELSNKKISKEIPKLEVPWPQKSRGVAAKAKALELGVNEGDITAYIIEGGKLNKNAQIGIKEIQAIRKWKQNLDC